MVVAGTVVGAEFEALGKSVDEFFIPEAGDADTDEGPVGSDDAIEFSYFALFDEVFSVLCLWFDQVCDIGKGIPGLLGVVDDAE